MLQVVIVPILKGDKASPDNDDINMFLTSTIPAL
jgi:hypothetical protein